MSSYVVLARRWRPRTFATLVGQGHVTQALTHALTMGRVPHAFLFSGIRGVGKTTLARLLAMCLDCEQGVSADPCGQCTSCREIVAGNHPDVLEIDAASRTKVEQMREVLDMVGYSPAVSRYKVYILDEVHMLSSQSFNALLKTLEEPPAHVKFIFATTEPRKIPATILSRCQRYDLKRVPRDLLTAHLRQILETESIPFDPAGVEAVVRSAGGSVRDALSLLDQVIAHGAGAVRFAAVSDLLGLTDPESILHLLDALLHGRGPEVLQGAADFYNHGVEPDSLVRELLDATHRLTQQKLLGIVTLATGAQGTTPDILPRLVAEISLEHFQMVYQVLLRGSQDLRIAEDALQALEMLLLRVAYLKPVPSLEKLLASLPNSDPAPPGEAVGGSAPGSVTGSAPGIAPDPAPVVVRAAPVIGGQPLTSWQQLVSFAASREGGLAVKLEQLVVCSRFETDPNGVPCTIALRLASDIYGTPDHFKQSLAQFLTAQGMPDVCITVEPVSAAPRRDTLGEAAVRLRRELQARLTEKMSNHPVMQKIITRLQAELVRVEPLVSGKVGQGA
ncbi:MAG: DNA polymerase III subunit gamma/tau [Magnetococcales bacterium]|nr:DNA polymerase III subunit gamma/tau [Magnetococcales bacterium]